MGKSIDEWAATIQAEKDSRPELTAITSNSAVGAFRLIRDVFAFFSWILESVFDLHKKEVAEAISKSYYGTNPWYVEILKAFQLNDTLELVNGIPAYPPGSSGVKIITRATAKTATDGTIFLKVAADGSNPGELRPLTTPELVQVRGYIDQRQPAGAGIEIVSLAADRLKLEANIYYDPLLPVATVRAAVIEAVSIGYLKALAFDGVIFNSKIQDAIQAVAGVVDVEITNITARSGATSVVVTRIYETKAGYIVEEDTPNQTFTDTLTFIPNYAA